MAVPPPSMSPNLPSPLQQSIKKLKDQLLADENLKLRPLHWSKIRADDQTVWRNLQSDYMELDENLLDMIKSLFM